MSKLYQDAALNLAEAEIDWGAATSTDLRAEMDRVERVFRNENGQWGQLVIEGTAKAPHCHSIRPVNGAPTCRDRPVTVRTGNRQLPP